MEWLAGAYDLRQHIEFDTEVTSLVWDEAAALWKSPDGLGRGRGG